jgi:hypothetical protein
LEAPLVAAVAREQKPSFPGSGVDRMAAVYDALLNASAPLDARAIAQSFRQGARVEPAIARLLAARARLGQIYTVDGKTFALRRRA